MKALIKPRIIDVIEDDGMFYEKSTGTYYDKENLKIVDFISSDITKAIQILIKMKAWRKWAKGDQNLKDMPEMPQQKEIDEAYEIILNFFGTQFAHTIA